MIKRYDMEADVERVAYSNFDIPFVNEIKSKDGEWVKYSDVSAKAMQIIEFMVDAEQTGRNFEDCLEAWNKVQEMLEDFIK